MLGAMLLTVGARIWGKLVGEAAEKSAGRNIVDHGIHALNTQ